MNNLSRDQNMSDLRKLIDHLEHIEQGGELIRELDPATGRIVSKPVTENIGKLIGAAAGGAGLAAGASWLKDKFFSDKPESDKPTSNNPNATAPGNVSDFSNGSQNNTANAPSGQNTSPDDDPTNPKTWPPGVKPAPDFGYLDSTGKWIPTPFHVRNEAGDFNVPRNSPANLIGIRVNQYTPFQKKVSELNTKNANASSSLIEQSKPVNLPSGAPQIPGYKQIDASRFSTDSRSPGLNKSLQWVYAYQSGKNTILIAPRMFYNMKLSIGRHYADWGPESGIRDSSSKVSTENGPMYVTTADFNSNDMILQVVVHASANGIGSSILKNIKI